MKKFYTNPILLSPTDESAGATEVDPLSEAAGGIAAPTYPCLQGDRICRFTIAKASVQPKKDDPSRSSLVIQLKTTKDYPDTEGKNLGAGFAVTTYIGISETPEADGKRGRTMKNIREDLAMPLKACGLKTVSPRDLLNNPAMLDGQTVDCKVSVIKGKNGYPDSNGIKFVLPA